MMFRNAFFQLIIGLAFLASSVNAEAASNHDDDAEILEILKTNPSSVADAIDEREHNDPTGTLPDYQPSFHYKTLMSKVSVWRKKTYSYCMKKVRTYQCENSEFKDLKFLERHTQLMSYVDARLASTETSRGLEAHRNGVGCIMARETGILEPITISGFNCMVDGFGTDLGLGQVTMRTFLHVIGLTKKEILDTVNAYYGRNGVKKKKLKLTEERANQLPVVTSVYPFNTLEYRLDPMRMYEEMADSPEFQIDMILEVLKSKKEFSQNDSYLAQLKSKAENTALTEKQRAYWAKKHDAALSWYQQKTYVNYNGSDTKEKYGAAVYACKSCLDHGKKDTAYCLGLATGTKKLTDFEVCSK